MNIEQIEIKYKELIEKAIDIMIEINDPVHGLEHVKGVVDNTILLLEKVTNVDKEVCILSAYWHDVGRKYGKEGHEVKSAEMLKVELINRKYDNEFIEKCYNAICNHGEKDIPSTIEGIVIRDADKLDNLGIRRWRECILKNVRTPRIILNLKEKLLIMEYSKEIYDKKAKEWLNYIKEITIGN